MATLSIQLAGLPAVSHVLKDDTVTVGRMKGNTIVIDDESVSLAHARITRKNGEFHLKDLNSTNGTRVNGQAINEVKLNDLDRISFAGIPAQYLAEAAVAVAAAGPVAQPQPVAALARPAIASAPLPAKKAARVAQPMSFRRLIRPLAGLAGGLAVLGILSILLLRPIAREGGEQKPALASAMTLKPEKQMLVQEPKPAVAPPVARSEAEPAGKVESVEQLAIELKSPEASERRRAAAALHSLGPEASQAVSALRAALADSDSQVQVWAALTLVNNKYYDHATIPIFTRVLQDDNPVLRQLACLSLGLLPYEDSEKQTVVPALSSAAAHDQDEEVRKAAVSALNIISPDALARASSP